MVSKTDEKAFEQAIEKHLTGTNTESLNAGTITEEPASHGIQDNGYKVGFPENFNAQYAIDERLFWQFLEKTQQPELAKLKKYNPNDWQRKLLERFDRLIKKHGILHLLKKGISVDNSHFQLLYPAPLASTSDSIRQKFAENIFSCTRQVRYSQTNPRQEIDMVLFINGMALITLELKNAWTGQTARYHGQKQYRNDRDTSQPLLNFGRCLVHMAVDTDEVYMTTKLAGKNTFFLPFNKGHNHGQGNPPNPTGHKTAYLWQEIFTKTSLANIIQHFVRLDGSNKDPLHKRTLFFPRYHQLDVVRKLIDHAAHHGVGHAYLIQHSAGSGKSNSITWAAYQLIEVYPAGLGSVPFGSAQGTGSVRRLSGAEAREAEGNIRPLFDSVIVVTDRLLLDKQLRDNIKEFSEVKNIIAPAHKSSELKSALENGKKIIITSGLKLRILLPAISIMKKERSLLHSLTV